MLLTVLNEPLMRVPIEETTAAIASTMNTTKRAYSAAVGPSSLARKRRIRRIDLGLFSAPQ